MASPKRPPSSRSKGNRSAPNQIKSTRSSPPLPPTSLFQPTHASQPINLNFINGSLRLPNEVLSIILQELAFPAEYCDLGYITHEFIRPPIDSQHQKVTKRDCPLRKDRATITLVCHHWTKIVRSQSPLYRDLIITSFKANCSHNVHFDEDLFSQDYAEYCQRINRVQRIDIDYSATARASSFLGTSNSSSSSPLPMLGSRRSTRLKSARNRAEDIELLMQKTTPERELMLLLNRFSVSPMPIPDHPFFSSSRLASPHSPPNPIGSHLRHLNISANAASLPVVLQVVSGCENLERLALFNVTYPRASTSASGGSSIYRPMNNLKTLQLQLTWPSAQNGGTYSSPWFSGMVAKGFALPKLSRLRIHRSDSGVPVPINFIYLILSHAPIEHLDIGGNVGSTLPAAVAETQWGASLRQLEISVAERVNIGVLESFRHLHCLEVLVINGLAGIIASLSSPSQPQHSTSTENQDLRVKEAWLSEIFHKTENFCKRSSLANLVIGDLGDSVDTYGPAWKIIVRYTSFLETEIKGFRVWARKDRSSTPTRAVDYIEKGREDTFNKWREETFA